MFEQFEGFHFARLKVKTEFEESFECTWAWKIRHNPHLPHVITCRLYVQFWCDMWMSEAYYCHLENQQRLWCYIWIFFIFFFCCEMRLAQREVLTVHSHSLLITAVPFVCMENPYELVLSPLDWPLKVQCVLTKTPNKQCWACCITK